MRKLLFGIFTVALSMSGYAQPGTITNIQISQRPDGSMLVDIYYDLSGEADIYDIAIEASFDGGSTFSPVPPVYLEGAVNGVSPGSGWHIVWDGMGSFPNMFSSQAQVRMLASGDDNGIQPGEGVTDIDGNFYPTVIIGNQEWMAENLRVTRDADGNDITRYCNDNDETNCELYGGLYTWHTVMNGESSSRSNPSGVQGICPTGWHVPSDAEWTELVNYVASQGYPNSNVVGGAGNALKSCRQVGSPLGGACNTSDHPLWTPQSTHYGTDEFGFSAVPCGYRATDGSFYGLGGTGYWWSATQRSSAYAYGRSMFGNLGYVFPDDYGKAEGLSLRCVRVIN